MRTVAASRQSSPGWPRTPQIRGARVGAVRLHLALVASSALTENRSITERQQTSIPTLRCLPCHFFRCTEFATTDCLRTPRIVTPLPKNMNIQPNESTMLDNLPIPSRSQQIKTSKRNSQAQYCLLFLTTHRLLKIFCQQSHFLQTRQAGLTYKYRPCFHKEHRLFLVFVSVSVFAKKSYFCVFSSG